MFEIAARGKWVILGVGVPTALGLLYYLLRTAGEEDEDVDRGKKSSAATSRQTVIEVPIPRKAVGAIIGRQGGTIKDIQEKSGAKVNFKDDTQSDDTDRMLVIRGTSESAQSAECLVRHLLANMPVTVQEEMQVPKYALGRIIGRGGESIRQMSRASKTKILIDKTRDSYHDQPQIITIIGTKEQIVIAKSLIQEKLDEEEEFRAKAAVSAANREKRQKVKEVNDTHNRMAHAANTEDIATPEVDRVAVNNNQTSEEKDCNLYMEFPKGREFVEVYVSAIASPGHFWVQTIGAMALQLDKLSETMTRYYDGEGKNSIASSIKIGDIVAAPFENDRTWYRAKVMDISNKELDLFYIDYGDSAYMDSSLVKSLSPEYLTLPFQAIECRLSGVKPNGEWTEDAFNKFEELTHCAKWKVLVATAVKFTGSIPHLQLIDTNGDKDIRINEEMIKCGFAVPDT